MDILYSLGSSFKNTKLLAFILIILSVAISYVFYYNKTSDEKKKINNYNCCTECLFPGAIISLIIVGLMYTIPLPVRKMEFLEEDFNNVINNTLSR
jgi:uncharacterized membrane protein